jgi:hypothetical protein
MDVRSVMAMVRDAVLKLLLVAEKAAA